MVSKRTTSRDGGCTHPSRLPAKEGEVRNVVKSVTKNRSMPEIPTVMVFLHIPRTGGTTLRLVMENNLPMGEILPIYGRDIMHPEQVIQRLHEPTRRAIKVVRGHIPYGIHNHLQWAQCFYFSLVRNPIERVWSLWYYAKRHESHHLCQELRKLKTIQSALELGVSPEFNNGMCRQLSGLDKQPFPQEVYAKTLIPYGETDRAYETAVEHFDHRRISLGTTEYFDAFLSMVCDFMEWPNRDHEKENKGPTFDRSGVTKGDLQAMEYYNQHDMELWTLARRTCE